MSDAIDSGEESNMNSVLNVSDTEFVSEKPVSKIVDDTHYNLVTEANFHVASELTKSQQEDCEVLPKKRKCQLICDIKWSSRKTCHPRGDCTPHAHVQHNFDDNFTPADVFIKFVNVQGLIDHIVSETNIYVAQKGSNFLTNHDELKAFFGFNYLIDISKLPSVANYREVDHYFGNDGLKNVMTQKSFKTFFKTFILQTMRMMTRVTKVRLYILCLGTSIILSH